MRLHEDPEHRGNACAGPGAPLRFCTMRLSSGVGWPSELHLHHRIDHSSREGLERSGEPVSGWEYASAASDVIHAVVLGARNNAAFRKGQTAQRGCLVWAEVVKRKELAVDICNRDSAASDIDRGSLSRTNPIVRNRVMKLGHADQSSRSQCSFAKATTASTLAAAERVQRCHRAAAGTTGSSGLGHARLAVGRSPSAPILDPWESGRTTLGAYRDPENLESSVSDTTEVLVLDLLEWIGPSPRPYGEVLDAWRTSCPRLTIWEDANDRGFIACHFEPGRGRLVSVSAAGLRHLRTTGASSALLRAARSRW